jgi:hypothetical protein
MMTICSLLAYYQLMENRVLLSSLINVHLVDFGMSLGRAPDVLFPARGLLHARS